MKIVSRAEWKARPPKSAPTKVSIAARTATCVHHDGPAPIAVGTFLEACALMRKDQNQHMDANGWADIGYNYLVISAPGLPAIDGMIFEGRGRDVVGAHCKDHNTQWIGVQVAIGGGQAPSPAALASTRWLHDTSQAAAGHALKMVGHSDGFPTACPDKLLLAWVRAGMPATTPPYKAPTFPIPTTVPTTPRPAPKPARVLLVVDGDFGDKTRRRLQQWAGVKVDGALGPLSWAAIQRKVKVSIDGLPGPQTYVAIQRLVGAYPDGAFGPVSIRALQAFLNRN